MTKTNDRFKIYFSRLAVTKFYFFVSLFVLSSFAPACRTTPKTDLRALVPGDAMVYLEINDVQKNLESMIESRAFREIVADRAIDFSAFENMQLAVAVTGFEFSENQTASDNSVLNFKPKFVAVAETHAWSWQTRAFAENQINNFVAKKFGEDARLEKINKFGGEFFTWTAADNRKVFAYVRESLIYFGNDAAAIERCLAVKNGETESLTKNESLRRLNSTDNLASGYVSPAGIEQFAALAGVAFAVQTTEETDGRNFIARVLPNILQKTTREIVWTAAKTELGIEDKYSVSLNSEISSTINESFAPPNVKRASLIKFLPLETFAATRYSLKNPIAAWRELLLISARNTDVLSGKLLNQFSGSLLEPYGIINAEKFLTSIESEIITAQFDENNEKSVFIVRVKNAAELKRSISGEFDFNIAPVKQENAEIWYSEGKAAAFIGNDLILGDRESVLKCLQAERTGKNSINNQRFQKFAESDSVAATFGRDFDSAEKIAAILAGKKNEKRKLATFYLTETYFSKNGFERRTVSDFGLVGTILKQWEN